MRQGHARTPRGAAVAIARRDRRGQAPLSLAAATLLAVLVALAALGCSNSTEPVGPLDHVKISGPDSSLAIDQAVLFEALPLDRRNRLITGQPSATWVSSNPAVASVSESSGLVTGHAEGTTTLTATVSGVTGSLEIVVQRPAASLAVSPKSATVGVGAQTTLGAVAKDEDGTELPGRTIQWESLSTDIATVVPTTGVVTGVAVGTARIVAAAEGLTDTAVVTVQAPVATIELSQTAVSVLAGSAATVGVTLKDAQGTVLTGRVVSWTSSDPTVTRADESGRIIGVAPGTATLTANAEGKEATLEVTVSATPLTVVGQSNTAGGVGHAFRWREATGMKDLGTLGGPFASAHGVNDNGQVVGTSTTAAGAEHAFVYTDATGIQDLGTLPGGSQSGGAAVSNSGVIVGNAFTAGGQQHAVRWVNGQIQDLGTLGGSTSEALGINATGTIVGKSVNADGRTRAFIFGVRMQELPPLTSGGSATATAIALTGAVVGYATTSEGKTHAFIWTSVGGTQDLGTLGGSTSVAYSVNERNEVVGLSQTAGDATEHAFIWTAGGGMRDLGTLPGSTFSQAHGINKSGQVTGVSLAGGANAAFLYTPGEGMRSLGTLFGAGSIGNAISTGP